MDTSQLLEKLKNQIQLIDFNLSNHENLEIIALNIATNIRVLVHDTQNSTSLLNKLCLKSNLSFYDTSTPKGSISYWKGNFSIEGWDLSKLPHIGIVGKEIHVLSESECEIKYTPIFKDWDVKHKKENFDNWWNTIIFDDNAGLNLTRKQLILNAANKDGVHI